MLTESSACDCEEFEKAANVAIKRDAQTSHSRSLINLIVVVADARGNTMWRYDKTQPPS